MSSNTKEIAKDIEQLFSKFRGLYTVLPGNDIQQLTNFCIPGLKALHRNKEILLIDSNFTLCKILTALNFQPLYQKSCLINVDRLANIRFSDYFYFDYDQIKRVLSEPEIQTKFDLCCRATTLNEHFANPQMSDNDAGDSKVAQEDVAIEDEELNDELNNLHLQKKENPSAATEKPDVTMKPSSDDKSEKEREVFKARRKRV